MKEEIATFAGGCFWCTEALFIRLKGVISVSPGYSGGTIGHPSYEAVCSGTTGHAEAIQITFNPSIITFETLIRIFFGTHDPTTLNRQGPDAGTQYRSAIFYHSENQKKIAEKVKNEIDSSKKFKEKVVTEISPFTNFYEAEDYHKRYYEKNSYQRYCQVIIDPKVQKLLSEFSRQVKEEYNRI